LTKCQIKGLYTTIFAPRYKSDKKKACFSKSGKLKKKAVLYHCKHKTIKKRDLSIFILFKKHLSITLYYYQKEDSDRRVDN